MNILQDTQIHRREIAVELTWHDLRELIQQHIGEQVGLSGAESREISVKISQLEEGSPSYHVDKWRVLATGKLALDNPA